ncbi:nanos homolog 3-like [Acanthaster planci]|uniref:Nanos homolog 3-like n=1 Tax=Acanthaster planci TaxID=133434 RepID=A0A8B7Y3G7_ACAPL|nr:nanos homolog 3-like [Acanthaster planci]
MSQESQQTSAATPRVFDRFFDYLGLARLITKTCQAPSRTGILEPPEGSQTYWPNKDTSNIDSGPTTGFRPFTIDELSRESGPSRRARWVVPKPTWCVFCKNNGESEAVYTSHVLKNSLDKVVCPRLGASSAADLFRPRQTECPCECYK